MTTRVLFVCLGNICRSPLAEAVFAREAERLGLAVEIDSAGTGDWHVGRPPDARTVAVAARNGIDISHLRSRQVSAEDFHHFDHIVALDAQNLADLRAMRPAEARARLSLLLDHSEERVGQGVADPCYCAGGHFDQSWAEVSLGARGLAEKIAAAQ